MAVPFSLKHSRFYLRSPCPFLQVCFWRGSESLVKPSLAYLPLPKAQPRERDSEKAITGVYPILPLDIRRNDLVVGRGNGKIENSTILLWV
jgi:hypothetical protein